MNWNKTNYLGKFENGDKNFILAELIKIYNCQLYHRCPFFERTPADSHYSSARKRTFVSRAPETQTGLFDVETFQIKGQKSKFSLLNVKYLKHLDKLGLNPTRFYKIGRTARRRDDTYIFHQTYIPRQYIVKLSKFEYISWSASKEGYHIHGCWTLRRVAKSNLSYTKQLL